MDSKALLKVSWNTYLRNFLLIFGGFLIAALLGGVTLGVLIGPMLAGFIAICKRIFKGEKPEFSVIFSKMAFFLPTLLVVAICLAALLLLSLINFIPVVGWLVYPALSFVIAALMLLVIAAITEHGYTVMTAFQFGIRYLLSRPRLLLSIAVFGIATGILSLLIPFMLSLVTLFVFPLLALFIVLCLYDTGLTVGSYHPDLRFIKYGGFTLLGLMILGLIFWAVFGWRVSAFGRRSFLGTGIGNIGGINRSNVIKIKTPEFTVTDEEGNKIRNGVNLSLPKAFPKDIPIYSKASIYSAQNSEDGRIAVNYVVEQSVSEVLNYYRKELPRKGWSIAEEENIFLFSALTAQKENRLLYVNVLGDETAANVTLLLEDQE